MSVTRTRWGDERVDDLKITVDEGFKEVKGRLDRVDGRVDALHRAMVVGFLSLASLIIAAVGVLVALR